MTNQPEQPAKTRHTHLCPKCGVQAVHEMTFSEDLTPTGNQIPIKEKCTECELVTSYG